MRQHKYCMHSIKKIGACRKRKKKKACQQVTSAPRDLLLQGTAAFIICGSRAAARPPASPTRPACSGSRAAGPGAVPGRARGGRGSRCGRPPLLLLDAGGPGLPPPPPQSPCCLRGDPGGRCVCVCVCDARGGLWPPGVGIGGQVLGR